MRRGRGRRGQALERRLLALEAGPAVPGLAILERCSLSMDLANNKFLIRRYATATTRSPVIGWTGLAIAAIEGEAVVTDVEVGSPSARSGIRIADRIVSIDGFPVRGYPRDVVHRMLSGRAAEAILSLDPGLAQLLIVPPLPSKPLRWQKIPWLR